MSPISRSTTIAGLMDFRASTACLVSRMFSSNGSAERSNTTESKPAFTAAIALSEATTPSLAAWKAFSEGWSVGTLEGHAVAIPFFNRAIEIDPKFASAYAILGRDYSAIGEMELASKYTRRAFEERERANDQEKFFIDFSYDRLVTGNLEKAMETCQLWTHMYPRDVLAHGLYGATAKALGRFDKTLEEENKAVEVDPDHPYPYIHLISLSLYQGNFPEARRWLERAAERKLGIPDFLMMRYLMAFLEGNTKEMEAAAAASEHQSEIQDWIWGERGAVLAFAGRLHQARVMSGQAVEVALQANRRESAAQHEAAAAVREALFENPLEARTRAAAAQKLSRGKDAQYGAALAFSFAGDSFRAQALTKDLEQRYPEDTLVRFSFLPTLRAIAAIQHGEPSMALDMLGRAARYELGWQGCCSVGFVGSLYPIYVRGEAYLVLHRGVEAAAEFQKILDYRGIVGSNPIALLAHWKKGKALRLANKTAEAKLEYERFLSLWREADPDVPVLRRVTAEYKSLPAAGS
jgi:tetratricopeptide (TPR) repeat protein